MGYRKVPIIHTLEFEGQYKGLIVRMKSLKIGEMRKVLRLVNDDDEKDNSIETLDAMVALIAKGLVSWNLEEEDGAPIGPSLDAVDDLEFDLLQEILSKWLDQISGPDEELGKGSSDGSLFPGLPPTMEAL